MPVATKLRLNRSGLLLALISSAFAGQVHAAAAGRVEFAIGGATLASPNGQQRPATRGAEVNSGDVVRTTDGRVQVRMADGSYISLQPNTEFGIKEYKFEGKTDGTESAFYSLLKGAMRTVTGLIGRVNRNRYQVATPTATVGIRGTGGLIQVRDDGSTLVQGTSGIWFLANPSGSINVPAGVAGEAPSDPNQPPKETEAPPTAGPAPLPPEQGYVQGEQTNPDGTAVIASPVVLLSSDSGYAVSAAFFDNVFQGPRIGSSSNATAVFSGPALVDVDFNQPFNGGKFTLNGQVNEVGNDGVVGWGRWVGDVTQTLNTCDGPCQTTVVTYGANQGLHYVVGTPTASMPLTGRATYNLLGATAPTYVANGLVGPGSFSGSLNVDFGGMTVGMNLSAAMPDGKTYAIGGSAPISGNSFTGFQQFGTGTLSTSGTNACISGCNALVQGFFAGSAAERAGLAYHINDSTAGKDVVGAAAFTKQ